MKIYIGSDHNGHRLKKKLIEHLNRVGYEVEDEGNEALRPEDDFPEFASKVVHQLLSGDDSKARGILICGSGQGMAMAANRFRGIRAAVCWDREQAKMARNDDDANVLALPARVLDEDPHTAIVIMETFLNTPFEAAQRFVRRIRALDDLST